MIVSTYRVFTKIFLSYFMWQMHLQEWKRSKERDHDAFRLLHMWGDDFFTICDLLGFDFEEREAFITILKSLFRHYNSYYEPEMHYLEDILSKKECEKIVDFCTRKEND